jgi:hypothetical protein
LIHVLQRPTVRRWCEHGYSEGFDRTRIRLHSHFESSPKVAEEQAVPETKIEADSPVADKVEAGDVKVEIGRIVYVNQYYLLL